MVLLNKFHKDIIEAAIEYMPFRHKQVFRKLIPIPLTQGGLGLTDITKQVLGRRASYIYDLITHIKEEHPLYKLLPLQFQQLTNNLVEQQLHYDSIQQQLEALFQSDKSAATIVPTLDLDIPGKINIRDRTINTLPYYASFSNTTRLKGFQSLSRILNRYIDNDPEENITITNLSYHERKIQTNKEKERQARERNRIISENLDAFYIMSYDAISSFITPELPDDITYRHKCTHKPQDFSQIIEYLKAWYETVDVKTPPDYNLHQYLLSDYLKALENIPDDFLNNFQEAPNLAGDQINPITSETFRRSSAKYHKNFKYLSVVTDYWKPYLNKSEDDWAAYFRWLALLRRLMPNQTEWFYYLQVNVLNQTAYSHCHLCHTNCDSPKGFRHCYFECLVTKQIWNKITGFTEESLNIEFLICNPNFENAAINKINYFLAFMKYLLSKRFFQIHYAGNNIENISPLNMILIDQFQKLFHYYHHEWVDVSAISQGLHNDD